jgi:hypothetical protein
VIVHIVSLYLRLVSTSAVCPCSPGSQATVLKPMYQRLPISLLPELQGLRALCRLPRSVEGLRKFGRPLSGVFVPGAGTTATTIRVVLATATVTSS